MSSKSDSRKHLLTPEKGHKNSGQSKKPRAPDIQRKKMDIEPAASGDDRMETSASASGSKPKPSMERSLFPEVATLGESPPEWFIKFFEGFESRLEKHIESITSAKVSELTNRISDQEEKITSCSIQIGALEGEVKKLKQDNAYLIEKLDDLENRGRRNNLILHGVPEKAGPDGKENVSTTVNQLLQGFVGLSPADYSIDRCHRTPGTPKPRETEGQEPPKPRMIHVRFTSWAEKENVRASCIRKFKASEFQGKKLFVAEDFSQRIVRQRKEKMAQFKELKSEGKKPFFLYPSKLAFRQASGKLTIVG